jgi:hypothetical protein
MSSRGGGRYGGDGAEDERDPGERQEVRDETAALGPRESP